MKNKLILLMLFGIFFISLVSSSSYKQGSAIDLKIPTNITGCVITLSSPNSVNIVTEEFMDDGIGYANYTINNSLTLSVGEYKGYSNCSSNEIIFQVTSSGRSGNEIIWFSIFIILFVYGLTLLGFFKENAIIVLIGGMFMIFLSVYMIREGIIIYRDDMTLYFSYITFGLGAFFSLLGGNWLYND